MGGAPFTLGTSTARAATLRREMAMLREGPVPATIGDARLKTPSVEMSEREFLLRLPSGMAFHYRAGEGTTIDHPPGVPPSEVELFLHGSVYGAIGWINGLVPIHASAVVHDGRVHAFAGPSGEGKSTLAAALGRRGWRLFADDVVMLDPDGGAIPGPGRLKLWSDALGLTQSTAGDPVRDAMDKFYVTDRLDFEQASLPLARLYILSSDAETGSRIAPIRGAARFAAMREALYRHHFFAAIASDADYVRKLSALCADLDMFAFNRSREKADFDVGIGAIEHHIRDASHG